MISYQDKCDERREERRNEVLFGVEHCDQDLCLAGENMLVHQESEIILGWSIVIIFVLGW